MARMGHDSERASDIRVGLMPLSCGFVVERVTMERVTRIELALSAWEADVLPLNYTRERPADLGS